MAGLFITGAGTGVGKTFVGTALIGALRAQRQTVEALKPVVSGFDPADWADSDPGLLLAALGRPLNDATLQALSPWRYAAPLSPDMAAAREGRGVDYPAIVALCRRRLAEAGEGLLLIEGVGGVMSPIDPLTTNLDLIEAIGAPVLLVAGGYLGTISHTLTSIAAMGARGVVPRAVVVGETNLDGPPFDETVAAVARLSAGVKVVAAGRWDVDWPTRLLRALSLDALAV